MSNHTGCPAISELQAFALGHITVAAQSHIEKHLRDCSACVEKISSVSSSDPLVETMRHCSATTFDPSEKETIEALIDELQRPLKLPAWMRHKLGDQPVRQRLWTWAMAIIVLVGLIGAGAVFFHVF